MDFIEVTADCTTERRKTLICIDNIISISEYGGNSKRALIYIQQPNGEKLIIKCCESYRMVKKRLLEHNNKLDHNEQ